MTMSTTVPRHEIRRVSHELAFRRLQVLSTSFVTPLMKRVTVGGPELAGFSSASPDDHVKLFFPLPGRETVQPALPTRTEQGLVFPAGQALSSARDYTPLRYDAKALTLDLEFVLHGDGPASTWGQQAAPGQWLALGGPRGSRVVPDDFDNYVIVGDETALPAIGAWLERLPAQARVIALIEIADDAERQALPSPAQVERRWLPRNGRAPGGEALLDALKALAFPPGDTFVWVATEAGLLRLVRHHLIGERGHDEAWMKASGYWKQDGAQA